jgi:hypothetical protein
MLRRRHIGHLLGLLALVGCAEEPRLNTPYGVFDAPVPVREARSEAGQDLDIRPNTLAATHDESSEFPTSFFSAAAIPGAGQGSALAGNGWPRTDHIVADHFTRTVITDELIVGLHCEANLCVAASKDGGLFTTDSFGDWYPQPTTLPSLTRFFADANIWVACPTQGRPALLSTDGGTAWRELNFSCGHEGHRTLDLAGTRTVVLFGGRIRIGLITGGGYRWIESPIPDAHGIASRGNHILLLSASQSAVSSNAGQTFRVVSHDLPLTQVYDIALSPKGIAAAVGQAELGERPFGLSHDGGLTWTTPTTWPTRSDRLDFVTMASDGRLAASSLNGGQQSVQSDAQGMTWRVVDTNHTLGGAVAEYGNGFAFASPRGIAIAPRQGGMYLLGLTQPLVAIEQIQPRVALGLGVFGGIYRSEDGGTLWYEIPRTSGLSLTHLLHLGRGNLVALGESIASYSSDSGLTWTVVSTPNGCSANWLTTAGDQLMGGCADGSMIRSSDGGRHWDLAHDDSHVYLRHARWVFAWGMLVGLDVDGQRLHYSNDMGTTWRDVMVQGAEAVAEIQNTPTGLSIRTISGRLATCDGLSSSWAWLNSLRPIIPDATAHRKLADGRWIVLGPKSVWALSVHGQARSLAPANGAHSIQTTPSGDVLLLAPTHTLRLARKTTPTE